jgi:hypothetical protein
MMRAHLMAMTILAGVALSPVAVAGDAPPDDVLAAIAADAAASGAPPAPASPLPPPSPPPSGLQSQAIDNAEPVQGVVVEPRAVCSVQNGDDWQKQAELTFEQCAAALENSPAAYDANGLKHAYWDGTFLSASAKAIYQSPNGHDWTKLRDRAAP